MRSEAWRKPLSVRPRESGGGNERKRAKPRWSAERRASRVMGRKAPRKRLAYRVISAFTRVFDAHDTPNGCRCTRTSLGAPPTPSIRVSEAKLQSPGAKNAPRERDRLFDIVKTECSER